MKEDKHEVEDAIQILPMPEYKIELLNEKLIKCLDIINRKDHGSITMRELKDSVIEAGLIHVDEGQKKITVTKQPMIINCSELKYGPKCS